MIDLHGAKALEELVPSSVWNFVGYALLIGGSYYVGRKIAWLIATWRKDRGQ